MIDNVFVQKLSFHFACPWTQLRSLLLNVDMSLSSGQWNIKKSVLLHFESNALVNIWMYFSKFSFYKPQTK